MSGKIDAIWTWVHFSGHSSLSATRKVNFPEKGCFQEVQEIVMSWQKKIVSVWQYSPLQIPKGTKLFADWCFLLVAFSRMCPKSAAEKIPDQYIPDYYFLKF